MKLLFLIYELLWLIATPILRLSPRLGKGWDQRTLKELCRGPYDLWIQAASGGEAMLSAMVIEGLQEQLTTGQRLRVLATAGTSEGIKSLSRAKDLMQKNNQQLGLDIAYFPLDRPSLMKKAFATINPRLAVLVETELWPGYLGRARKNKTPVVLINGRISEKSYGSYYRLRFLLQDIAPETVYAISELDRQRLAQILPKSTVMQVNNLKFDRIKTKATPVARDLQKILPAGRPFILLGSIRKEEEPLILETIRLLLQEDPELCIGLFPKHLERAEIWTKLLEQKGITVTSRRELEKKISAAQVIVWDVFGELANAYSLANAAFVGGSLVKLGGQNFLEPLLFGLRPVIGPHWKNFLWVGREIVDQGLVVEVQDQHQLAKTLLQMAKTDEDRQAVCQRVDQYCEKHRGGTRTICSLLIKQLNQARTNNHG